MLQANRHGVSSDEGRLACEQLVSDTGQSVLVASTAGDALKLLWSHIQRGANYVNVLGFSIIEKHCDAEIGNHRVAFGVEQDVFRLEIAVDNILLMDKL